MEHGTSTAYGKGCRCQVCKDGRAAYAREWRRRNPDSGKVPRKCERCGADFMAWPDSHAPTRSRVSVFCSRECAGNKPGTGARVALYRPGHPIAGIDGRVLIYRYRLFEKIGAGVHPCHWCGDPVTWNARSRADTHQTGDLIADHLDSNPQNNEVDNLVPACQRCNGLRGAIRVWRKRTNRPLSVLTAFED